MARKKKLYNVEEFDIVIDNACGLDIHKDIIMATIKGSTIPEETREFNSTTRSLIELNNWLVSKNVTHVIMESTGVYWKPVHNILEMAPLTILVVNARNVKYVPGHKTDKKDSAWLCKLLRAGLLRNSFIAPRWQRDLRDLVRYRRKLEQQLASEHNRLIRILEDANLKLSSVFSDIRGKICTAVIDALIDGETDPKILSSLCNHPRLKHSKEEIERAVEGNFTGHHRFMIIQIRKSIENIEEQIGDLEKEIEQRLRSEEDTIRRLALVPGLSFTSAHEIIAEIGLDMSVFPEFKNLASWAGVAPGNNESAGKKKSTRTNKGNKAVKSVLVQCAWAASRKKNTFFAAKYSRLAARRGKKKALIALAREILQTIYYMLLDGTEYFERGPMYMDDKRKNAQIKYHEEQLKKLRGDDSPATASVG